MKRTLFFSPLETLYAPGQTFAWRQAHCHVKPAFTNAHVGVTNGKCALPSPAFQVLCACEVYSWGPWFHSSHRGSDIWTNISVGNLLAPVRFIWRTNPTAADITDNPHTHTTQYSPSQLGWNCPDWFNILCGQRYHSTWHPILNSKSDQFWNQLHWMAQHLLKTAAHSRAFWTMILQLCPTILKPLCTILWLDHNEITTRTSNSSIDLIFKDNSWTFYEGSNVLKMFFTHIKYCSYIPCTLKNKGSKRRFSVVKNLLFPQRTFQWTFHKTAIFFLTLKNILMTYRTVRAMERFHGC